MLTAAANAAARDARGSGAQNPRSSLTDERVQLRGHEAGQTVAGDL
jgi:hypothetical protein